MKTTAALLLITLAALAPIRAQTPPLISYQGRVAVNAVNFDGTGAFRFALVNEDGSVTYWSNDGTSVAGSAPAAAVSLPVTKGLYSVLLGDTSLANMLALPTSVFANPDVRLRVWFDDGVNGSELLAPDQRLAPSPYLADGAVTSAALADAAVSGTKIAPASIDGTHVAAGSLDFSHLTVPAAPGAGQLLGFNGTGFEWTAPGSGDGIWTLSGPLAYRTGNVAVGTAAANAGIRFTVGGASQFITGGSGGVLQLGNPSGESGLTIGGNGAPRADVRFDGTTLKLLAGPAGFVPSTFNGIVVKTNGAVGMGVLNPEARLHVADPSVSVTQLLETGGGTNAWAKLVFRTGNGDWHIGTSRDFLTDAFFIDRIGTPNVDFTLSTAGDGVFEGDVTGTRLWLRPDPAAPTNAAVLCASTSATNFIPYNTALARPMDLIVRNAIVRQITITGGADLAEPFPVKEERIEPGAVVVIDDEHPGRLRRCTEAYDSRVAGIVSGAGGVQPGIALRQDGVVEGAHNVALTGRVYVKADARYGAIRPGDLLTTSDTPGHAMRATDRERTPGAVLGKAMTALPSGQGEVLVLVTLQ